MPNPTPGVLPYPVILELLRNVAVDLLGGLDIRVAARRIAALQLCLSSPEQRRGVLGIDAQGRIVILDGVRRQTDLQVDETAAVERVDEIGLEAQRFIAVAQRHLQIALHGASPAAVVERLVVL